MLILNDQGGQSISITYDVAPTLRSETHGHPPVVIWNGKADGAVGNGVAFAVVGDHENRPTDMTNIVVTGENMNYSFQAFGVYSESEVASAMKQRDYKDATDLVVEQETGKARRLTPLECTRLQGFPDYWVDIGDWTDSQGRVHKDADTPKYKALGNSICLPMWEWVARRICAQYERRVAMASLFDGIGGFPLAFSRCGAVPVWASEIEEFPIAVTKKHFPDAEE